MKVTKKKLVFLRHYRSVEGYSMKSFGDELVSCFEERRYDVINLYPERILTRMIKFETLVGRLCSYCDQYILFNIKLFYLSHFVYKRNTLYIIIDQALSPYLIALSGCKTIVHIHDLMALYASRGRYSSRKLAIRSIIYQRIIAYFFSWCNDFIAVSKNTAKLFSREVSKNCKISYVYNPITRAFSNELMIINGSKKIRSSKSVINQKYILHVGRNWYKNREGLILLWIRYCRSYQPIKLVLVGELSAKLKSIVVKEKDLMKEVIVFKEVTNAKLISLYQNAEALVFPSICEGFGWPIIEALICRCPVVTTNAAPMNEIAGEFSLYLDPFPTSNEQHIRWAEDSAKKIYEFINQPNSIKQTIQKKGLIWSQKFNEYEWINKIEEIYLDKMNH